MLSQSSIVLLGRFNPAIFQPQWFSRFKLLPSQEIQWAEREKIKKIELKDQDGAPYILEEASSNFIVGSNLANITFESFKLAVQSDRFSIAARRRDKFSKMAELTQKIFNLLEHTPVNAMGFNFEAHWKMSDDSQSVLRDILAGNHQLLSNTFTKDYSIGAEISSEKPWGKIRFKLEPSNRLEDAIFFRVNFHRNIESGSALECAEIIEKNYSDNLSETIQLGKSLLGEPNETWQPVE